MAKKFYTNLDLQGNNLVNAVFENLSVVPESPKEGQIYFDVEDKKDKIFDGTKWIARATTQELNSGLDKKVDKVAGKQLSTNDFSNDYKSKVDTNTSARHTHSNKAVLDAATASFTAEEKTKLSGIAAGAQVNVIESIKVNGEAQTISAKSVNINVPTKTSQLQNDSEFVTLADLDESESGIIDGLAGKVDKVEGKGLSTNDFTNDYKSKVDANTTARHTHSNKAILDATTASFTTDINNTINSKANDNAVVKLSGNQTIAGVKTFSSVVNFANKTMNALGDDASFGDGNVAGCMVVKGLNGASGIQLNPYSGTTSQKISINGSGVMTITGTVASTFSGNLNGTASKATADGNGNNIAETYATKAEIGGSSVKKQTYQNPALTPSGGVATWTVTHTLNSQDICATLRRVSDNAQIFSEIVFSSATQVVVKMNADANVAANVYKLTLVG